MRPFLRSALLISAGLLIGGLLMCLLFLTGVLGSAVFQRDGDSISRETLKENPLASALHVAACIKADDFAGLSSWIHPEKGVTFTPFSTVDRERDLNFTGAQVAGFATDKKIYLWGLTDAEGAPIQLTALDFMHHYVGGRDYTRAPLVAVGSILKTGNRQENVVEVFPDAIFVELHIPQVDPKWEGADWSSLKVVFEEYHGQLKVIALIHSEMSI